MIIDTDSGGLQLAQCSFRNPIDLKLLKTTLYWQRDAQGLLVATSDLEMHTPDATVHGKIALASAQPTAARRS